MELVKTALPAVAFLTFTHTLRIGRHVRMLILVQRLPNRSREMLDIVGSLFALLVFIMISIYVWDGAWETFLRRDYEGTQLRVPIYPTHFAVALKYDMETMVAPTVVAKGQNLIAEKIKQVAREAGVPTVENKPLAQALFHAVDIGQTVPEELYRAVAEVLAYVFRLREPQPS